MDDRLDTESIKSSGWVMQHARGGDSQQSLTWPDALLTQMHLPDKIELKTLLDYSSP